MCEFSVFVDWADTPITDTVTVIGEDDDGNVEDRDDQATVRPRPPGGGDYTLTKSATPSSRPEPGGEFTYTITITPQSSSPVEVIGLTDFPYGDITDDSNPAINSTTCTSPVTILPLTIYQCQFSADFGVEPGFLTDTVTVTTISGETLDDDATVEVTDVLPAGSVTKVASPNPIDEPGGTITYTVEVFNDSIAEPLDLTLLFDDVHGNITDPSNTDIESTNCVLPRTIGIGDSYACTFDALHFGDVGETQTDFVFARLEDNEGNSTEAFDKETISFSDILPEFSIVKTPSPATIAEPGGSISYSVVVTNDSVEDVTITSLVDDQDGAILDLNGQGSCLTPQTIEPGDSYTCSFSRDATGNAGDTVEDTITGLGVDDEGNVGEFTGGAEVEITPADPVLTVVKTADPPSLPEPGGDVV